MWSPQVFLEFLYNQLLVLSYWMLLILGSIIVDKTGFVWQNCLEGAVYFLVVMT